MSSTPVGSGSNTPISGMTSNLSNADTNPEKFRSSDQGSSTSQLLRGKFAQQAREAAPTTKPHTAPISFRALLSPSLATQQIVQRLSAQAAA